MMSLVSSKSMNSTHQEDEIIPLELCEPMLENDVDTVAKADANIKPDIEIKSEIDIDDTKDNTALGDEFAKEKLDKAALNQRWEIQNRNRYACDFPGCSSRFSRPGRLAIHQRTHTGEKPFACPDCDKSYNKKHHLQSHILRNHNSGPSITFLCDLCDKQFVNKDTLRVHKKRAHDDSRYKCSDCEAAFGKRQDFQSHKAIYHPKID
eukprot:TRINITY_DN32700_c0_g1_i2.p1 TRINITY_DN32700_c0_g1~~TRINITY_DN32700_c0_g1_i2.p1  ORF type:complete len:207 (+),score=46.16 TRINITY_DN32700_c0_g1_i2:126-746(+)